MDTKEGGNRLVVNGAVDQHWRLHIPMLIFITAGIYKGIPYVQGGQF